MKKPHYPAFPALEKKILFTHADGFFAQQSDWSKRWLNQDAIRNLDDQGIQRTPGWSHDALVYLIEEVQAKAIGHEILNTDAGLTVAESGDKLPEEYYLLLKDIYQIEVLNNLDQVPASGALITVAFPHFSQVAGSLVRAIAILP